MAKKLPGNSKAPHYRCRVDASITNAGEERSVKLGPGLLLSDEEYRALVSKKLASPEWFEPVEAEEEKGE